MQTKYEWIVCRLRKEYIFDFLKKEEFKKSYEKK